MVNHDPPYPATLARRQRVAHRRATRRGDTMTTTTRGGRRWTNCLSIETMNELLELQNVVLYNNRRGLVLAIPRHALIKVHERGETMTDIDSTPLLENRQLPLRDESSFIYYTYATNIANQPLLPVKEQS